MTWTKPEETFATYKEHIIWGGRTHFAPTNERSGAVFASDLYASFLEACAEHKQPACSVVTFGQVLRTMVPRTTQVTREVNGRKRSGVLYMVWPRKDVDVVELDAPRGGVHTIYQRFAEQHPQLCDAFMSWKQGHEREFGEVCTAVGQAGFLPLDLRARQRLGVEPFVDGPVAHVKMTELWDAASVHLTGWTYMSFAQEMRNVTRVYRNRQNNLVADLQRKPSKEAQHEEHQEDRGA